MLKLFPDDLEGIEPPLRLRIIRGQTTISFETALVARTVIVLTTITLVTILNRTPGMGTTRTEYYDLPIRDSLGINEPEGKVLVGSPGVGLVSNDLERLRRTSRNETIKSCQACENSFGGAVKQGAQNHP